MTARPARDRATGHGFVSATFIIAVVAATLADQLVDAGVRAMDTPRDLLAGAFRFAPSTNDGIAFGLLQGTGPVPIVLAVGAMVAIVAFAHRNRADRPVQLALGLLLGGALANLVERLTRGAVLDYVDLGLGDLRWPTFNVGDVVISIAILILIAASLWHDRPTRPSSR